MPTVEEILKKGGLDVSFSHMKQFGIADLEPELNYQLGPGKSLYIRYPGAPYSILLAMKRSNNETVVWQDRGWRKTTPEEEALVRTICFPEVW